MGVRYTIEGDLLTFWLEDQYETSDLLRVGLEARGDPELCRPFRLLFDLTGSKMSASHDQIVERVRQLAEAKGEFVPRVAVVVAGDLHHALTRVHDGYASGEGVEIQPFRTRADAIAWIDQARSSEGAKDPDASGVASESEAGE